MVETADGKNTANVLHSASVGSADNGPNASLMAHTSRPTIGTRIVRTNLAETYPAYQPGQLVQTCKDAGASTLALVLASIKPSFTFL